MPTLLVTHDFEDAATLADRVGVLVDGRVLQLGSPQELVGSPSDPSSPASPGRICFSGVASPGRGGLTEIALDGGGAVWTTDPGSGRVAVAVYPGRSPLPARRPNDSAVNHVRAPVSSIVSLGNRVRVRVGPLTAEVTAASVAAPRACGGGRRGRFVQGDGHPPPPDCVA